MDEVVATDQKIYTHYTDVVYNKKATLLHIHELPIKLPYCCYATDPSLRVVTTVIFMKNTKRNTAEIKVTTIN